MTPRQYLDEIALPSLRDFLAQRNDRRLGYLASVVAFHVCDHVAVADGLDVSAARAPIKTDDPFAFEVVMGICIATKHFTVSRGPFRPTPGAETVVEAFALDSASAGLDRGRIDHPGLLVTHGGQSEFLDRCLQRFLLAATKAYPGHFGGADLTWAEHLNP